MLASEMISDIKNDLKLDDKFVVDDIALDSCVSDVDIIRYINESLTEASNLICRQYEDYFLTFETKSLVADQRRYSLPSNILVQKIRRIWTHDNADFLNSSVCEKVTPLYRLDDYLNFTNIKEEYPSNYAIINNMTISEIAEPSYPCAINFFPMPSNSSRYYTIQYIKKPNAVLDSTSKIDFDFLSFIKENTKYLIVVNKDMGNPMTKEIKEKKEELKQLMLNTMANKIPDDSNEFMQNNFDNITSYGGSIL